MEEAAKDEVCQCPRCKQTLFVVNKGERINTAIFQWEIYSDIAGRRVEFHEFWNCVQCRLRITKSVRVCYHA